MICGGNMLVEHSGKKFAFFMDVLLRTGTTNTGPYLYF